MADRTCPWSLEEILPHAQDAILLHGIRDWGKHGVRTFVRITPEVPFCEAAGVPIHIGLEYMAQACGVWSGCMARRHDLEINVGYLLGTRNFEANVDFIPLGAEIEAIAEIGYFDGKMGMFDCRIVLGDEILATARLSAYQPIDGLSLDD
ncbi:MAG: hypothetical protein WD407_12515 [Rhodospirillales bacterium]